MSKRILIVSLSLGGGHGKAGEVVAEALRELAPDADVRCVDLRDCMATWLRLIYVTGYLFAIRRLPWLYGFLYRHPPARGGGTLPRWMQRLGLRAYERLVREHRPDVILCTQLTASEATDRLCAIGAYRGAAATVVTDFDAHPAWRADHIDAFFVPDDGLRERFAALGIAPGRIEATGVPIDPAFEQERDIPALKAGHGVRPDVPVVLLMGGSLGLGSLETAVRQLVASGRPLDVLVVAGHNARLRGRLDRVAPAGQSRLLVFSYIDFVADLMAVADLFVSKPGGLSMTEALTIGVPTLVAAPLAGQEQANAAHLAAQGVVQTLGPGQSLVDAVTALLDDAEGRRELGERSGAYVHRGAAHCIARRLLELAGAGVD